jgi:hypothetical protein
MGLLRVRNRADRGLRATGSTTADGRAASFRPGGMRLFERRIKPVNNGISAETCVREQRARHTLSI